MPTPISGRARALAAALLLTLHAPAGASELRAAVGTWDYELAGTARNGARTYDFERDLELGTGGKRSVQVEWDTSGGGWPDLALGLQRVGASGDHEETTTVTDPILGLPITNVTRTVVTGADLRDTHLTARYPWRWGGLRLAGGLTVRRLEGSFRIEDSDAGEADDEAYDELFPQLHLNARLPLAGIATLVAETDAVSYDGNRAVTWRAGAEMDFARPLLLEAALQDTRYHLEVGGDALDARLSGLLLRVGFAFR